MLLGEMVITPWGDASTLRERRLPPGPGTPRAEVAQNQRERLFAAMVATAAGKGYAQTSVGDLAELSGVSSRTFYDLFADKEACFLATLEAILAPTEAITAAKMSQEGSWLERAEGAMAAFVKMLVDQPAAARLCLVETYAAGPAATQRIDEALGAFAALMQQAFEEQPERRGMPREMTRGLVGGLRKVIHTRLHRGTEAELTRQLPELMELGLGYRPPPKALRGAARRRGGRGRAAERSVEGASAAAAGEDPAERIVRATAVVVAAKGYRTATIADVVEAAGASLNTFYAHFASKEEAFDAALYSGRARMLGVLMPIFRRARNWPEGVRAMTQASLAFLAAEPEFARLITIEVYAAGAEALERRDLGLEGTTVTLEGGLRYAPGVTAVQREAIMASLYAMVSNRLQRQGAANLPEMGPLATYMTLAPFIGAEDACQVANGGSWIEPS
jgi:AcrR family transcriptional regulator